MKQKTICKNIVLFISAYPSAFLLHFARAVAQLDDNLFVRIISDKPFKETEFLSLVVHIEDDKVLETGFYNSCLPRVCRYRDRAYNPDRKVSGWDKALYYATHCEIEYEFAWIAEDDVYFRSPAALSSILSDYEVSKSDLICREIVSRKQHPNWIHWPASSPFFRPEYVERGFVPFCRLSKVLLQTVHAFADREHQLTYIEVLFTSLCRSNDLTYEEFNEKLRLIMYRPVRSQKEAEKIFVGVSDILAIHPVKEITEDYTVALFNSPNTGSEPVQESRAGEKPVLQRWDPLRRFLPLWTTSRKASATKNVSGRLKAYVSVPSRNIEGLFDSEWYLARNPTLGPSVDPLAHYLKVGIAGSQDPNPLFDNSWYLSQYPDVNESGLSPATHYLEIGAAEGRDPSPNFDTDWYLGQNPDVKEAGINALVHYLKFGMAEGRMPKPNEGRGREVVSLYRQYPALREAEYTDPRISVRRFLISEIPANGKGAVVNVFSARFAREVKRATSHSTLYLIDPWWKQFGDYYPDLGSYTAHGALSTRATYHATLVRCPSDDGKTTILIEKPLDWLQTLDDYYLDWVYLDSTYEYNDREFALLVKKIKPNGVICGDCWISKPDQIRQGASRVVNNLIMTTDFRIIFAGMADQWMLRRGR